MKQTHLYVLIGALMIILVLLLPLLLREKTIGAKNEVAIKPNLIQVEIKGEVVLPGTYVVKEGLVLGDLIRFALGLTPEADLDLINFQMKLVDNITYEIKKIRLESVQEKNKININTASLIELMTLKGIGEVTASKIITYRENNGPFISILDIKKVSGIGEQTYEQIKDHIQT
ncbi:MAG TPA: hypothetical protein DEA45_00580 [Acholeplasmataceae bacterium]|nr:hypothetical protein [Acholeplasmataceae bacterium]